MTDGTVRADESMRFEEAFASLQELVRQLESGQLTLDESLRLFEEGVKLTRLCSTRLDEAESKIEQLLDGTRAPLPWQEEGA